MWNGIWINGTEYEKKKEVGNEEEEEWRKEEGARQDLAVWFRIKYYDKNVA